MDRPAPRRDAPKRLPQPVCRGLAPSPPRSGPVAVADFLMANGHMFHNTAILPRFLPLSIGQQGDFAEVFARKASVERTGKRFCRRGRCLHRPAPRQRPLVKGSVVWKSRLYRRTPVAAVGAASIAARNRLRLMTACRKRTLDTGGHTGHPYRTPPAWLRHATSPQALRALGEALVAALDDGAQTMRPSGRAMRAPTVRMGSLAGM